MSALQEFANFITLNVASLAATYEQLLIENGENYQTLPADGRMAFARKLIKTAAEACESESSSPLCRLFEDRINQSSLKPTMGGLPHPLAEVECLGQTLTPIVTSLEAGKFLWQALFEARTTILHLIKSIPLPSVSAATAEGGQALSKAVAEQMVEHPRTDETLAEENYLLRTLIDHLPDYIFVKDTESRFIIGNMAIANGIGVAAPAELIGKTDLELFPPEIGQRFYADEQAVIHSGQPLIDQEELNINQAGIKKWFLTTKVPLRDNQGQVIGLVGLARDITERKLAEEMLHKAHEDLERRVEERTAELAQERNVLRTLIDALPDPIYAKDTESRFILGNAAVARIMNADSPEQLIGKSDFDFYPQELATQYYADERNLITSGQPILSQEEPSLDDQSNRRWVLTTKVPLRDSQGQVIGFVGVGRDITEYKEAQEALAQERNLLRTLIDNLPDHIYVKDIKSRFILANSVTARNLGVATPEELIGKTDFDFFPVEMATQYHTDEQNVISTGQAKLNQEEPTVYENGRIGWASTSTIPLRDSQGQIIGLVGVSRDITEHKRLEQQIQESLERRARQVQTSTEVAQQIGAAAALEDLFRRVVNLIQTQFGYYHVQVYTLLEGDLVLQEGTGDVGQRMKEAGHKIALSSEKSLVVRALWEGEPVLVPDTLQEPTWLPNPLLPETKAELAVPIALGAEVLGVLDIQSDTVGGLSEEDQLLLVGLCGQIAVAIDNRRIEADHRRAEERLAEERNLLRALTDNLPDYIYVKDAESRFLLANEAMRRHLGAESQEAIIGKTDFDFSPRELAEQYYATEQAFLQAGQPMIGLEEPMYDHETDSKKWVSSTKVPFRDSQGRIVGLVGLNRDITPLKQAQEVLAEERRILRALIDALPDYVFVKDRESRFIIGNLAIAQGIGVATPDELIGKTDLELFPPEIGERFYADEQALMRSGQVLIDQEELNINKEGVKRWFSTTKIPLRDDQGQVIGLVGLTRDLTERKQVQEALVEERRILRTLIDSLPDEIYFKDAQSRFLNANIVVAQVHGLTSPEELIGKTDLDLAPYEDAIKDYHLEQAIIQSGQAMINRESYSTDTKRWRLETKVPVRDEHGQVVGLVGFNRFITELKEAEAERERLLAEAERRARREQTIREITDKLRAAPNLERLLEAATQELGQHLKATHIKLELGLQQEVASSRNNQNGH